MLLPNTVIGILGGGQLGRMTALALAQMGYQAHIFAPEKESPAFQVTPLRTLADYGDKEALESFLNAVEAVTLEFENIPLETLRHIEEKKPLFPSARIVDIAQNRLAEKKFFNDHDIETARWADISSPESFNEALEQCDYPCIVKTARFGYDGKGQYGLNGPEDVEKARAMLKGREAIMEEKVVFEREIAVIIARDSQGDMALYPPIETVHENHILAKARIPASLSPVQAEKAQATARKIALALDLRGVLAVEMFHCGGERFLANEMAPRPHNSGHWTVEASPTSQFAQLARIVAGWPLGATDPLTACEMVNILGGDEEEALTKLGDSRCVTHFYGKTESRPGRKMGHQTILFPPGR